MKEIKPKSIKGLAVEYNGEKYDKITYMSCYENEFFFEHMPNESTIVNIRCKPSEAKITFGGDK